MTWAPSPSTRAAGDAAQGRVRYVAGSTIGDGEPSQLAITPAAQALRAVLRAMPGVVSVGAARSPAKPATVGRVRDAHEDGRALDVMLVAGPQRAEVGSRIASWLVDRAEQLRAQLVIYDRAEWSSSTVGPAWESYTGPDPHTDHVHVVLSPDATPGDVGRAAAATARGDSQALPLLGLALALALAAASRRR